LLGSVAIFVLAQYVPSPFNYVLLLVAAVIGLSWVLIVVVTTHRMYVKSRARRASPDDADGDFWPELQSPPK
jgi:multisubunit Na+/H+ antiporter MnhC subunit